MVAFRFFAKCFRCKSFFLLLFFHISPTTQEKMVFHRFDSFLNRLNTMVEFFNTAVQVMLKESYCTVVLGSIAFKLFHIPRRNENISPPQFLKLEKVEIGGIRGKALTSNINKVYEEFRVSKYKYRYKYKYGSVSEEFWVSSPYPQL